MNWGLIQPKTNDEYYSPKYVWENIIDYIPKDKEIWEAFYGDGTSGKYLEELGLKVIHEKIDFFENNKGDIIVSNPPFSKRNLIIPRLKLLNKPFILLIPLTTLSTQYFAKSFKNEDIQLIIPRKRIQFNVLNKKNEIEKTNKCSFDCAYFCYKMNLPKSIIFLEK